MRKPTKLLLVLLPITILLTDPPVLTGTEGWHNAAIRIITPITSITANTSQDSLFHDGRRYRAIIEKNFPVVPGGRFSIHDIRGDVYINGNSTNAVRIVEEIYIYSYTKSEANRYLDRYRSDYIQSGNTIEVKGPGKSSGKVSFSYTVTVPDIFSTLVETSGGDIEVLDISGDIKLYTSGGDIELSGLSGKILAETSGGDISTSDCRGTVDISTSGGDLDLEVVEGDISAKTSGGDITARRLRGNGTLRTSGGDIDLRDLEGDGFEIKTSGGNIRIDNAVSKLDAYTSGGDLVIEDIIGDLRGHTSGGDIEVSGINGNADLHTSGGDITADEIGGYLEAFTSGGDIEAVKHYGSDFSDHHVDLRTSGGDIDLAVPRDANATIDATIKTSSPRWSGYTITSDFPSVSVTRGTDSDHEITATGDINGGGFRIRLQTSNGNIRIRTIR